MGKLTISMAIFQFANWEWDQWPLRGGWRHVPLHGDFCMCRTGLQSENPEHGRFWKIATSSTDIKIRWGTHGSYTLQNGLCQMFLWAEVSWCTKHFACKSGSLFVPVPTCRFENDKCSNFKGRRQLRCGPENEWFPLCCERNMQNVCLSIYGWWFQSLKKCICHYWALCSDSLHLFTFFYMDVGFGIIMLHIGDGEANGSTSVWNRWDFSECGLVSGLSSAGTLWAHVDWHFYCVCLVL